ncbi:MAG: DNA polymerase III subunit gamma/tau [Candidatus Omnitrophota bacterium]
MSYTVYALKWRPQNFDEIVGQEHIVTTLKSALEKNRLAHAYLFAGPRGVGKTSTARILAKAINCKAGPTVNPCGKCSSCVEITQGRGMDVIEIDGASNRSIDDIRTLRENVKFAPSASRFKVYVIDEVHMLTPEAFNALLKTLEEPPEFVKFIFATTHPNKVPLTILSRCQHLNFRRIPVMEIVRQLEHIIKAEKINVDKDVIFAVARSSDGSMRDAESILDQLVSFSKEKISLKDVISILGLVEQEALFEITQAMIDKDPKVSLNLLDRLIDDGKDPAVFLQDLIAHFRNLMVAKITNADPKLIDLPEEVCKKILAQAQALSLEEIFSTFNTLVITQEMAKRFDSIRIPLEIALVRLSHDKKTVHHRAPAVKEKEADVPAAEPIKHEAPKAIPKKHEHKIVEEPPVEEASAAAIYLDDVKKLWQNALEVLSKIKISVASYLGEGTPIKLEKNNLTISFPKNYSLHKESLEMKENKPLIEKTFSEILKANLKVNFILAKEESVKNDISFHPVVRSALDMFNGRVIKEE